MTKNRHHLFALLFHILALFCLLIAIERPAKADPISAIVSGGLGLAGSIFGGITGAGAAKKAAQIQQQAAQQAGKQVTEAAASVNPSILAAAQNAGNNVTTNAQQAAAGVDTATTAGNKLLNPYSTAGATASGVLNAGVASGGEFNKTPGLSDLTIDPGYAFREQQGELALSRGAAARGAVQGGGFQKNINAFAQGNASQEYQNAFNRFETSMQNRFANVKGVSDAGQVASTTQAGNTIGSARYGGDVNLAGSEYSGTLNSNATNLTASNTLNAATSAGNYLTQGANAQAAGVVGQANAYSNALSGGVNAVTGPLLLNKLINPSYGPNQNTPTFNPQTGLPLYPGQQSLIPRFSDPSGDIFDPSGFESGGPE